MLRRSKTLSIVMSLCLCLAMLAPVFVAPQAAQAASSYSQQSVPTVKPDSENVNLGQVMVDVPLAEAVYKSTVTISLPSDLELNDDVADVVTNVQDAQKPGVHIYAPARIGNEDNAFKSGTDCFKLEDIIGNSFDLKVIKPVEQAGRFVLYVNGVDMKSFSGDVNVEFSAPSNSGFTNGTVVIAKSNSDGNTTTTIKSVKNLVAGAEQELDEITIAESAPETLQKGKTITLKITSKGVTWDVVPTVKLGWGFTGEIALTNNNIKNDGRNLEITLPDPLNPKEAGKLSIQGAKLNIDETEAKLGDVEVNIKGANMTEKDVVVGKYVDYGVTVSEKTQEDLTAGKKDQELGEFIIEEGAPGSLVGGRTITMELPDGLVWRHTAGNAEYSNGENAKIDAGDTGAPFSTWKVNNNGNERVLTLTVAKDKVSTKVGKKIRFTGMEIDVKPNYSGDIEITIAGSAGAKGTVKVGTVKPAVKLTANGVSNIVMGGANQKVADIVIAETEGGAIMKQSGNDQIVLQLDDGYKFAAKPSYTIDGDLDIDSLKLQNNDKELKIALDCDSAKASTITLSDVYVTALRYVPEGTVKVTLVEAHRASDEADVNSGSTALDELLSDKSAGNVVIANCVTPAEGVSSQFRIGSNVYTVNGIAKIMDVAPYINNSRTYVPVRYLAYALGVAESDVVWDAATSKVTITKGDKVVELTIGSTTITVNGEAQTMDVAPEITNSRTMLPARFVAEGLGATVGWDAASNTVYVQQ